MKLIFFFNDTATTEIYTLSLHDALPIFVPPRHQHPAAPAPQGSTTWARLDAPQSQLTSIRKRERRRSEEHTSELQSQSNLVCRPLLDKKIRTPAAYDVCPPSYWICHICP